MKKRVLKILSLCMEAKEMGHNVFFDYAPHVQKVHVYSYDDKYDFAPDEEADLIFTYYCFLDNDGLLVNTALDNMETAIQKLIDGEFE